jgi:deoxyribonuclease V
MSVPSNEPWPTNPKEARVVQEDLRDKVIRENQLGKIATVAGVDVGFEDKGKTTRAAVAVLDFPSLEFKQSAIARQETRFPYIPGYLSFREVPAILEALGKLKQSPDLILCDGQGLAHPRRFGLACHLGVVTGLPTIGVAKSRLTGTHDSVPEEKGAWVGLWDKEEIIGAVVRTRSRVSPLFISIGHRIDLETAIDFVLRCTTRYRLPETTRWAHKLASG